MKILVALILISLVGSYSESKTKPTIRKPSSDTTSDKIFSTIKSVLAFPDQANFKLETSTEKENDKTCMAVINPDATVPTEESSFEEVYDVEYIKEDVAGRTMAVVRFGERIIFPRVQKGSSTYKEPAPDFPGCEYSTKTDLGKNTLTQIDELECKQNKENSHTIVRNLVYDPTNFKMTYRIEKTYKEDHAKDFSKECFFTKVND